MTGSSLGLLNATNARDLGGWSTTDGRAVRRGVLFRANALNRLTEADVAALGKLGLASLIDFRHSHEVAIVGPDRLPEPAPAHIMALPIYDPEHELFLTMSAALWGEPVLERWRDQPHTGGAMDIMRELYRWFVTSELASGMFSAALRHIATAHQLPLLFHCTAGKDRTGWLAVLVLTILGVERTVVIDDYLRSNELNASTTQFILGRIADRTPDPELIRPILEVRLEYLNEAFAAVDHVFGSMDGYLRDGLGLDDSVFAALRHNLLE